MDNQQEITFNLFIGKTLKEEYVFLDYAFKHHGLKGLTGYWFYFLTDEEVMEKCVDQIIKELPEEIESRLHDQKVIREVLKEYKDNQVQWFKDYVADRAEYDEVFNS